MTIDATTPAPGSADEREFDVVLFGATGYVGRLIATELLDAAPDASRVALAGRDEQRVRAVAAEVGHPGLACLVADAFDAEELARLARRTRAVINVAGPYAKYGMAMAGACAQNGTHLVDLNGEVLFARDVIDAYDAAAKASGASLVTACGFDSVPSDLGVLVAADAAREAGAGELLSTTMHVRSFSGGLSGGTIDALRTQVDSSRHGVRTPGRSSSDPYALSPDRDAEPEPRGRRTSVAWLEQNADVREFTAPFFMARYNEQVVRRSNALLGWRYGRGFRYREVHDAGRGAAGLARAVGIACALPAFVTALATPGLRQVADRVLPSPGQGPSEQARARGHFTVEVHADTTSGRHVVSTVAARQDPGYGATAVMVSQAALALASGEGLATGASTPAVALGQPYAARLRRKGFTIDARVD